MKLDGIPFCLLAAIISLFCSSCKLKDSSRNADIESLIQSSSEIKLQVPKNMSINQAMIMRIDRNAFLHIAMIPTYYVGVFDTNGRLVRTIGGQGFGPGELRRVQDLRIDSIGQVFIIDGITEDILIFDPSGKWVRNISPRSRNKMSFEISSRGRLTIFRRAFRDNSFHIQVIKSTDDGEAKVIRELLPTSEESIRTHMLVSNSIASNGAGWILFAMMAAKDIKTISPSLDLSEIQMDQTEYKVSDTKTLVETYNTQRTKGLVSEIFKNSRVLSLGFVSQDVFIVTFATGRFEETKFFIQFYSRTKGHAVSKAFSTASPIYCLGNCYFAQWKQNIERLKDESEFNLTLRLIRFNAEKL